MPLTRHGRRLAVDIGGTFTDVVLEVGNELTTTKVLTTQAAPEDGAEPGPAVARSRRSGLGPEAAVSQTAACAGGGSWQRGKRLEGCRFRGVCQINSQVIACLPDTIGECRTFHIGVTASILTLFDKPFGSISVSQ